MKIAVVGLGNVGKEVFKEVSKSDHEVVGIDSDGKYDKKYDVYLICVYSTEQVFSVVDEIDFSNKPLVIVESTLKPGSEKILKKKIVEKNPNIYSIKEEARGAVARIHGYAARVGLGITRIKNHISDSNPISGKNNLFIIFFISTSLLLIVLTVKLIIL